MTARHSVHVRRLIARRAQAVAVINAAVAGQFRRGWRTLHVRLRELRKQDALAGWFDDWSDDFAAALAAALAEAAGPLSADEVDYWQALAGRGLMLDPNVIVQDYLGQVGAKIGVDAHGDQITDGIRAQVQAAVQAWYSQPDMNLGQLTDSLTPIFGASRALTIANNESTALVSAMTRDVMGRLGLTRWKWQTRLEFNVCKNICRPLHGKVFSINDPMPPEASHIGCMCVPAAVVE